MGAADVASKYTSVATRIFKTGQRMNKLINDLIDFTRTHLGSGLPVKPQQTNVAQICLNVVEELRTYHPDRKIEFTVEGKLDGLWDADRIAQLFSNLIGNALQYGTKDEPVRVHLSSETDDVIATVNNKGVPIDPGKLPTIFEPLVRLAEHDATNYTRETSLGIGLFIVREIVLAHSGAITVESSQTAGTTFKVSLPRLPISAPMRAGELN
jgi:signal transduction histidine kinase